MYNIFNTPATPLNNAHPGGFFLFGGLKRTDRNNILKDCFGIDEKILSLWIHTLVYIRNLCAHHSRIWNRTLAIKPKVPNKLAEWKGISNSKIFCLFLIFKRLIILPGEWEKVKNNSFSLHFLTQIPSKFFIKIFPRSYEDNTN